MPLAPLPPQRTFTATNPKKLKNLTTKHPAALHCDSSIQALPIRFSRFVLGSDQGVAKLEYLNVMQQLLPSSIFAPSKAIYGRVRGEQSHPFQWGVRLTNHSSPTQLRVNPDRASKTCYLVWPFDFSSGSSRPTSS